MGDRLIKVRNPVGMIITNEMKGIRGRQVNNNEKPCGYDYIQQNEKDSWGMIIINEMKGIRGRQVNKSEKPCGYDYNQRNERDSWETG